MTDNYNPDLDDSLSSTLKTIRVLRSLIDLDDIDAAILQAEAMERKKNPGKYIKLIDLSEYRKKKSNKK